MNRTASRKLVKMVGSVAWCSLSDDYRGRITRGILRGGTELVIDLDWGGQTYAVKLHRSDRDQFEGSWSRRGTAATGAATGTLYTSAGGKLIMGEWAEESARYHWWAELTVVEHFPDEQ